MHNWPEAPPTREYLSKPHRHLFTIRVTVAVTELNRQVEFHDMQSEIRHALNARYGWIDQQVYEFNNRSCEMIAADIATALPEEWKIAVIEVTEDDECGAILTFPVLA